ncbi:unnamed protein product [Sphenostylis stenocarpa]|uniref:Uncharacterized protein n=1 Tax=Sphenostylis stenocarpa TaxID=92480 RepID=A0AA86VQA3_9FABA|nr:unnamed protein product [Sphenostylis stenocarpa]
MDLNDPNRFRNGKSTLSSRERFLGVPTHATRFQNPSSNATATDDDLIEGDVVFSNNNHSNDDEDSIEPSSSSSPIPNHHHKAFAFGHSDSSFGILAALPENDHPSPNGSHFVHQKPSVSVAVSLSSSSSSSSARHIPAIPKPPPDRIPSSSVKFHQSAPVNVPMFPTRRRHEFDEDVGDLVAEEEGLPPHVIVARNWSQSPALACSVLEGVGRTLKGRDLRQDASSFKPYILQGLVQACVVFGKCLVIGTGQDKKETSGKELILLWLCKPAGYEVAKTLRSASPTRPLRCVVGIKPNCASQLFKAAWTRFGQVKLIGVLPVGAVGGSGTSCSLPSRSSSTGCTQSIKPFHDLKRDFVYTATLLFHSQPEKSHSTVVLTHAHFQLEPSPHFIPYPLSTHQRGHHRASTHTTPPPRLKPPPADPSLRGHLHLSISPCITIFPYPHKNPKSPSPPQTPKPPHQPPRVLRHRWSSSLSPIPISLPQSSIALAASHLAGEIQLGGCRPLRFDSGLSAFELRFRVVVDFLVAAETFGVDVLNWALSLYKKESMILFAFFRTGKEGGKGVVSNVKLL